MSAEVKPLMLVQFTKQTSMLGEQVTFSTNLPQDATQEEINAMLMKFGRALDARMLDNNGRVNANTGKNLVQMGLDPREYGFEMSQEEIDAVKKG